ncbi:hypothetical protein QTA58_10525 [Neorhizobium sp. CSC1952]|uniref:hypothetical protein n=1 Tax=Neorhizobium sp. CSC1952 TaxID=2978974 RepID=UPI0025A5D3DD|nr:hypothetical protein [Rhizobium sp. CSC1952]WJR69656.1 hypothetical protein QTA58_10525 [Rhizobium sp. CSC1952]
MADQRMTLGGHDTLSGEQSDRIAGQQSDKGKGDDRDPDESRDQHGKAPQKEAKHSKTFGGFWFLTDSGPVKP